MAQPLAAHWRGVLTEAGHVRQGDAGQRQGAGCMDVYSGRVEDQGQEGAGAVGA